MLCVVAPRDRIALPPFDGPYELKQVLEPETAPFFIIRSHLDHPPSFRDTSHSIVRRSALRNRALPDSGVRVGLSNLLVSPPQDLMKNGEANLGVLICTLYEVVIMPGKTVPSQKISSCAEARQVRKRI